MLVLVLVLVRLRVCPSPVQNLNQICIREDFVFDFLLVPFCQTFTVAWALSLSLVMGGIELGVNLA